MGPLRLSGIAGLYVIFLFISISKYIFAKDVNVNKNMKERRNTKSQEYSKANITVKYKV